MRRREFIALLRVEVTRSGILLALLVAPITGGWAADAPKRIGILATPSCPGPNKPAPPFFSGRLPEPAFCPHHHLRALMPGQRFPAVVARCFASGARARRLS